MHLNNRSKANIILAAVFCIFIMATVLRLIMPGDFFTGLLAFTAECALVGGIADWFAVTALFKKPLGFPWHTAIIPKNRDIIVKKVSELVGSELLSQEAITASLEGINLADSILGKVTESLEGADFENRIREYLGARAENLDKERISEAIDSFIKENLKKENVSEEIRKLLVSAFDGGKHREWLRMLLSKAAEIAGRDSTREKIFKVLRQQEKFNLENTSAGSFFVKTLLNVSKGSRYSNLPSVAQLIQDELLSVLAELQKPENPIYLKLSESSSEIIKRLDEEKVLAEAIQRWKNGILDRVDLLDTLNRLVTSIVESNNRRDEAAGWIADIAANYREDLGRDENTRKWLNDTIRSMLSKIISNEHHMITEIARETLESFTNERLIGFIEEKAGEDLQWIRINGSVVGSAAGIILYLFTNLFYSPFVVPLIHSLLGIG